MSTDQILKLSDGRTLGYAEYGDLAGTPVFYFTGGNSSRLEGAWFDDVAQQKAIRLIVPDRPGFGLSDFQPQRTLLDWPDDVVQLADALEITNFAIFGLSGGGPHVAATAFKIPSRLTAAAIVSGASPYGVEGAFDGMWPPLRIMYFMARRAPTWLNAQVQAGANDPEQLAKNKHRLPSQGDRDILSARPEIADLFRLSQIESGRNGIEGAGQEWQLYTRPWGFELESIQLPITLWYGEEDGNAPVGMGRYLASQLPNSTLNILPNEGHFSLINNHIEAILDDLLGVKV